MIEATQVTVNAWMVAFFVWVSVNFAVTILFHFVVVAIVNRKTSKDGMKHIINFTDASIRDDAPVLLKALRPLSIILIFPAYVIISTEKLLLKTYVKEFVKEEPEQQKEVVDQKEEEQEEPEQEQEEEEEQEEPEQEQEEEEEQEEPEEEEERGFDSEEKNRFLNPEVTQEPKNNLPPEEENNDDN